MPAHEDFERRVLMAAYEAFQQMAVRSLLHNHSLVKVLDGLAHLADWHLLPSASAIRRSLPYYYRLAPDSFTFFSIRLPCGM
jgi:hypothetical protein